MAKIKVLHVSYHQGCIKNLNFIFNELSIESEVQIADWNYNIGHDRSIKIWEKYKDYYNSFDVIITSDTCPLSRVFLQNNYSGKLIIWICNRFDYCDQATNDCNFPDVQYYDLIKSATINPNVKIFSYTKFEHEYARDFKNLEVGKLLIKPCAFVDSGSQTLIPENIIKKETFFIPQYHNDSIFMNLHEKCEELKINSYCGRYSGPSDLEGFKGIIHIPYAWSNLALFENWSIGNVYYIPSKEFLLELSKQSNFFWSPPFSEKHLDSSEWYLPEHNNLFIYFNDWNHLKELSSNYTLINNRKKNAIEYINEQTKKTLEQWDLAINNWVY